MAASDPGLKYALSRGISDITIRSSDGVLLFLHRKNLEAITKAFNTPEFLGDYQLNDGIISLPERSDTLEIVFSFIYPNKHPNLRGLKFEELSEIRDAVEKYQVFPAMNTCERRLM
ncbi:hypothetical protein HYPSUDRAFT_149705 [Hypholoma sublateritium FD-334 SS-4]|uniref:BTB domain-containing protein n=1 Tax=Hypholoma sublateritium (strain FD-334 SS-4) TaxID=945553 RepID=A0A0D2P342_HYPSF|nr:hypothetical protein HYPSUDRAFT_149705 [Hypholoma sublateritium FD-334 SS-4]